jgi:hypothetical protein
MYTVGVLFVEVGNGEYHNLDMRYEMRELRYMEQNPRLIEAKEGGWC